MDNIINTIKSALENQNWYSALVLSLILPDICGKIEFENKSSSQRYPEWFNKYLSEKYDTFLSGSDCYALRCSFLHEGISKIEAQRAKDALDHFVFVSNGPHCNRFSNCNFGDPKYDEKDFLQLSVSDFCQDMIEAVKQWLHDVEDNQAIQDKIVEMLEIHEGGFSIGNAIKFSG